MIVKSFEFKKINIKKHNIYLFYGENNGFKNDLINNNFKVIFKDSLYNYEESFVLKNKEDFFDRVLTKSFFEKEKLIVISDVTEKIKDVIEEFIEKKIIDVFFILNANKLDKRSKLRTLFEKDKNLICVPFYSDNFQTLFYIVDNFFKKSKIPISQETLNLIINRANGNRQNLYNELSKIESFVQNKKEISLEDIIKLTNLSENNSYSELVDNCLAKNNKKLLNIINENNYSSEDTILIIRTFLNKAKRLLKINEEIKKDNSIDNILTYFKPPIFWKDKDLVKQQLKNYSRDSVEKLINSINEIELQIKKNHNNSINILLDFIITQGKIINN